MQMLTSASPLSATTAPPQVRVESNHTQPPPSNPDSVVSNSRRSPVSQAAVLLESPFELTSRQPPAVNAPQQPPPQTPSQPMTLNPQQQQIFNGVFNSQGNVSIVDQPGHGHGHINAGDVVTFTNQAGQQVTRPITAQEAYNINFRINLVNRCMNNNPPWAFTPNTLPALFNAQGQPVNQNQFWERVVTVGPNGQQLGYLRLRPGVNPSDAIQDMFNNPTHYAFDCATATRVMNLAATMDTIGTGDFNQAFQGGINLAGPWDSRLSNNAMGFQTQGTQVPNSGGDWTPWGGQNVTPLIPGQYHYYERPNDTTSPYQGWNCIYLGTNPQGQHMFWAVGPNGPGTPQGNRIRTDATPQQSGTSQFGSSYYLSSLVGNPPVQQLMLMDQTPGPGN